jgi:uncharacterized protein (TIGR03083 family)
MSSDSHVARCLTTLRELSYALASDLGALSPAELDGPTNCPPWRVRDLAAHVVSSGEGFVDYIRNGLGGSVEPPAGDRHGRQVELESAEPRTLADALKAVTSAFEGLYSSLEADELEMICYHRRGNRSVRWYAAHRLAEVAFHAWDIQFSLGHTPVLDERVAVLLLPTLLESNAPRTYAAGLTAQRGSGERFLLAVVDDPESRWRVTIHPAQLVAERVATPPAHHITNSAADPPISTPPADLPSSDSSADLPVTGAPADLTITASAADLALLVYGRANLPSLSASGAAHLEGDPSLVHRFAEIFPRP